MMASTSRRLLLQSRKFSPRIPSSQHTPQWQRPISTTSIRCAKEPTKEGSITPADARAPGETVGAINDASAKAKSSAINWRNMEPAAVESAMLDDLHNQLAELDPEVVQDAIRKGKRGIPFGQDFNLEKDEHFEVEEDNERLDSKGFWAEGEEGMGPDEDYYGDDLTSLGHGELRKHRDLREYARLIAWELPLLSQLARPFEPPTAAAPFRFRYTSYLGESHPASNKVVVEFAPSDLKLTQPQVDKMIKLAGVRYNPSTRVIKMSCESYDTQAQNKRFLGDTIQSLIKEAKDSKDMFEDVPFDFRHHKEKKKVPFPKEWILTAERKKYLEQKRAESRMIENQRANNGQMVDGKTVIETSLPFLGNETEEVLIPAPRR